MLSLIFFIFVVSFVATVASRFRPGAWHEKLRKPSWNPPNWVFAPVWSLLYLAMALAGWLVWLKTGDPFHPALVVWALQLVFNGLWSCLFFGLHRPDLALVDILVLLASIGLFVFCASGISAWAAGLFVPYLLWVIFASVLNFSIWKLNRGS